MSDNRDDGWMQDKDGFWYDSTNPQAVVFPPYSEYPVDYSAEHDHDRDNFMERDRTEIPPLVQKFINVISALVVVLLGGAVLIACIVLIVWLWGML